MKQERTRLRAARLDRGWSLEKAAEYIGVGRNTLWRWEQRQADPYAYNVRLVCKAYGMPATELDLFDQMAATGEAVHPTHPLADKDAPTLSALDKALDDDLELRLQCCIYNWLHQKRAARSLAAFQQRLSRELETEHMHEQPYLNHNTIADPGRRDALRRIALLPLKALGLGALGTTLSALAWVPEDILTHCAAGITACEYLAKGQREDMTLASSILSEYLPTLTTMVKHSSLHRQEAARLAGQALLLKTTLTVHAEGSQRAAQYAEQGIIYGKESEDLPLQLTLLNEAAWVYACNRQIKHAVDKVLEAQYLLEHAAQPLPALVQSDVYKGVAVNLARDGREEEALAALHMMHETFSTSLSEGSNSGLALMMEHDLASLFIDDGKTNYYLGRYNEALDAFTKVVDPKTLTLRIPISSERERIENINYLTLASLKRPAKDLEFSIHLWQAGIEGARTLQSEQRWSESLAAYEILEALWPVESRVAALREHTRRW